MRLPAQVQRLAEQLVALLGMHDCRPSSIRIDFDDTGTVQVVTPAVTFRRQKGIDSLTAPRAD